MTVERLVQKIKLGERRLVQDSMSKLISMMTQNKETQEEIIKYLPENEISNIMAYLEDTDPYLRKLTARFFLDLVYGNYTVQHIFCDALGILPSDGKVCINKIPEGFKAAGKSFLDCLDILKKPNPEEKQEELPYCWHFTAENTDRAKKYIGFIPETEKGELEDIDQFIDPLHAMIGFIVRAPRVKKSTEKRVEEADKGFIAKYYGVNKKTNPLSSSMRLNSVNSSLDQSHHFKMLNNSKSPEREIAKNVSPVRKITAGIVSSRINYPRASNPKSPMISQSSCNTERLAKQKFDPSSFRGERAPTKNIERGMNQTLSINGNSIERENLRTLNHTVDAVKDKHSMMTKEPDFSIEIYDNLPHSKIIGSITDSQELSVKLLETSLCNSVTHQGGPGVRSTEKSPDVSQYKIPANNDKKADISKKNKKHEKIMNLKSKPLEVDKKLTSISFRDTNYSFSATASPKHNLLSKILKDKPIVKDSVYSQNHKTKQDQKKLNVTAGASPISATKHITQKFSLAVQKNKKATKLENEYVNKKYAFHSSLMKSIDASDHSQHMTQIQEELAKENVQDYTEKPHTHKADPKLKNYHISNIFKSPISTPRTPTDILKSTLGHNAKILNSRKSQDTSYLYNNNLKRKSEASIPLQNLKNRQMEVKDR